MKKNQSAIKKIRQTRKNGLTFESSAKEEPYIILPQYTGLSFDQLSTNDSKEIIISCIYDLLLALDVSNKVYRPFGKKQWAKSAIPLIPVMKVIYKYLQLIRPDQADTFKESILNLCVELEDHGVIWTEQEESHEENKNKEPNP